MVFPYHVAVAIHFHDGVHLGAHVSIDGIGIGPQGNHRVVGQVDVGYVKYRVVAEFRVVYPEKVVVRVIGLTGLRMLPQDIAIPVNLRKGGRSLGAEHGAVFEQIGIREFGPIIDHLPRHVDQIDAGDTGNPGPDEGIARIRFLRIPMNQFGRSSGSLIGGRNDPGEHSKAARNQDSPCLHFHFRFLPIYCRSGSSPDYFPFLTGFRCVAYSATTRPINKSGSTPDRGRNFCTRPLFTSAM